MMLIRLITWPYVRKHLLRSIFTTAGIVMGVGVFVAIHAVNESVLDGFRHTVERIAGRTQLEVSAGEAGLDEQVLERVQTVLGVRTAVPIIEAIVPTGLAGEGNLLILGVDMVGDAGLRDYYFGDDVVEDPLVFLAQPDSIIVAQEFARRNGWHTNSRVAFDTMDGRRQFIVRGILRGGGMSSAFGGNLAVMDIYAAQQVFGRGRKFDRIDMAVAGGWSVDQVQRSLRSTLGPAYSVESPEQRSRYLHGLLGGLSLLINITSLFALFIGMFVIYHAFAIAVTERRPEIGILRALGATRGQIRNLFLLEGSIAGLFGAAGGTVIGALAAKLLVRSASEFVTALSGVGQAPSEMLVSSDLLVTTWIVGWTTSIIAAWIPAHSAALVDPVKALQKGQYLASSTDETGGRRLLALSAAAGSIACLFTRSTPVFYLGYLFLVISAVLLAPFLSLLLARALQGPLKLVRPVEGGLAADGLIQRPRRTSAAITGLMLSIAMLVGMAGVARASLDSVRQWVTTVFNSDLLLSPSPSLSGRSFHFPAAFEEEVERVPGIAEVEAVRTIRVPLHDVPVMVVAGEIAKIAARHRSRRIVAGDYDAMHRLAAQSKGLIISENLMLLQKLNLGDTIELPTPSGMLRLPVVGVFRDYANQTGAIYVDLALFRRYWQDDSLDLLYVYLNAGVDPREAKQRILAKFGNQRRLFVFLNGDVRRYVTEIGTQWFGLTYIQIGVAVLVAVLGIVNALTVSILDRRRELAILRAMGGLRNQIRLLLWLEAAAVAFVGVVLGLGLGGLNLHFQIEMLRRGILAISLEYQFPFGIAVSMFPGLLVVAFLAALLAAESTLRAPMLEALADE